jgi:hypothetical protein
MPVRRAKVALWEGLRNCKLWSPWIAMGMRLLIGSVQAEFQEPPRTKLALSALEQMVRRDYSGIAGADSNGGSKFSISGSACPAIPCRSP